MSQAHAVSVVCLEYLHQDTLCQQWRQIDD